MPYPRPPPSSLVVILFFSDFFLVVRPLPPLLVFLPQKNDFLEEKTFDNSNIFYAHLCYDSIQITYKLTLLVIMNY